MESAAKLIYANEDAEVPTEPQRKEIDALLKACSAAPDNDTALEYAQRAADALPDDPQVQESVQRSVFARLNQDAFVAFLAETHKHYVITFRNSRPVVIPKSRTQPEIFPVVKHTEGERSVGMLWWLILGLIPAGIGTLILSPLVMGHALEVILRPGLDAREKRLAWVAVFLTVVLGLLGMFFALLLVLHLIG